MRKIKVIIITTGNYSMDIYFVSRCLFQPCIPSHVYRGVMVAALLQVSQCLGPPACSECARGTTDAMTSCKDMVSR